MDGLTETTKNSELTFSELRFEPVCSQLHIRRAKNLNSTCVYTARTCTIQKLPPRFWSEEKSQCCQARVEVNFAHCALHRLIFFCFFQYLSHEKSACLSRRVVLRGSHPRCPLSLPLRALSLSIHAGVTSHSAIGVVMHQPSPPLPPSCYFSD